jgi:nicotinamide-nucleotide amidase
LTLAVAESLTGGLLSTRFAKVEGSSNWFRGAVIAYASEVKHRVLGVRPGPVISETAAVEMARGVAVLLEADASLALTGVGGPSEQEGQPPGTVWVGLYLRGATMARLFKFDGDPAEVCDLACGEAVAMLGRALDELTRTVR